MNTLSQLSKKLDKLEGGAEESAQAQVIIYDPAMGAPVSPDDGSARVFFLIPDNGRDQ